VPRPRRAGQRAGFRETTREEYRRDLERDAIPFFGRMRLAEIEPRDVKRYVATLLAKGLAASSVRNALAPVRACLATAVEEGLIRSGNPASAIRVPRREGVEETGTDVQALTPDEARALIAAVPIEHRLFVEFLLATGLRFSEAIALRWGDIDLGRRRVLVRRRAYRGIGEPKSRYSRRDVPMSTAMATRLWEQRKTVHGTDDDIAFPSGSGSMLDYSNLYGRVFKPAAKAAGVPWAAFHTLRHTCATFLFTREGLNAKQVQAWLGHHSAAFTLDRYVHLLPDDLPEPVGFDVLGREPNVVGEHDVPNGYSLEVAIATAVANGDA
jgi:integrase